VSGGPFPRSRKLSVVWRTFSSIKKTLWRLAGLFLDKENSLSSGGPFLDKENSLVLGWH
jgi:hypothetical protein